MGCRHFSRTSQSLGSVHLQSTKVDRKNSLCQARMSAALSSAIPVTCCRDLYRMGHLALGDMIPVPKSLLSRQTAVSQCCPWCRTILMNPNTKMSCILSLHSMAFVSKLARSADLVLGTELNSTEPGRGSPVGLEGLSFLLLYPGTRGLERVGLSWSGGSMPTVHLLLPAGCFLLLRWAYVPGSCVCNPGGCSHLGYHLEG